MTYLMIHYDRVSDQLTAIIDEANELKVVYCATDHTLSLLKRSDVIKTIEVRENFPARGFIEYCFNARKLFGL